MAIQTITINQAFNAPVNKVFSVLSDHEQFGKLCGIYMKRVVDGSVHVNGLGSVRDVKVGVLPAFQETITGFVENERIEYKITKGSPIKNHIGVLTFTEDEGMTKLNYTIDLESKVPLTTTLIKTVLGFGLKKGLKRYADSLT